MPGFTNLTPHAIRVCRPDGSLIVEIPPSGHVVRVKTELRRDGAIGPVWMWREAMVDLVDLPPPSPGIIYIVSKIVAVFARALGRSDLVVPGPLIRDSEGRVIGCVGLSRVVPAVDLDAEDEEPSG